MQALSGRATFVLEWSKTRGHNSKRGVMPVSACVCHKPPRMPNALVRASRGVHTLRGRNPGRNHLRFGRTSLIIRPHPSCPTCGGACRPQTRIATLMSHRLIAVNHQGSGERRSESTHISGRHAMTSPVFASATRRRSTSGTRRGTTATRSPRLAIRRGTTLTKSHLLEA